jgi:type IV fimbrial biogenesis protein FimT
VTALRTQRGFNVIELLVVTAVIGILTMLSMPMYRSWLQNSQLRASAEGIAAGLNQARSDAVRLNATAGVRFVMTGNSWSVEQVSDGTVLQQGGGSDQTQNAVVAAVPGANSTITFGPLGQVMPAGTIVDFSVTHALAAGTETAMKCVADGGEMRCLNVQVRGGGLVRMCDPHVTTVGDPRKCLP